MTKPSDLEVLAHVGPTPVFPFPKKPTIDETALKDVIWYKGRIFEVPHEMIDYFAKMPGILQGRIRRAEKNGMNFMSPTGIYGCMYCNHYQHNVGAIMDSGLEMAVVNPEGEPGIHVIGCHYEPFEDIRWVGSFNKKSTGEIVQAQYTPCVVYDAMFIEMIECGAFNEYEVHGREFKFPTILDLERAARQQREEMRTISPPASEPKPEDSLIGRIMKYVQAHLRR